MTPTLPYPPPHARRTDPAESRAAAKSATPTTACAEWMMRRFHWNATYRDEELVILGSGLFTAPTVRRTRKALSDAGLIVECGEGRTAAGRACRKWRKA